MNSRYRHLALSALAALVAFSALTAVGCREDGEKVADPPSPAPADLSTPESAVRSYLDYVTLSYRMANSELSTQTMTPAESVRVDSYIELNRQKRQGIDQRLREFAVRSRSVEATRAVLAAEERWTYRYFSLDSLRYTSPPYEASYETTYTLVETPRGWLVDEVAAEPLTEVK